MTMTIRPTRTTDSLVCKRLTPLVIRSRFEQEAAFVQGLLKRFWPLVTVLIVLDFSHGPHPILPLHCTVKHYWSILHFDGESFGLTYGALKS